MSLLDIQHKELINAIKSENLVIFAGAGVSKSVGLPLWSELIENIIEYIGIDHENHGLILTTMFERSISKRKIFDVLTYIENNNLKSYVDQILIDQIFKKGEDLLSSKVNFPLHSKLWQLSTKIITPNYDILFESCKASTEISPKIISNKSVLHLANISSYQSYLLKIHGNISEVNEIIFYESQYLNQYKKETAITTKFKELVANHPILFVGTSMTDPFINEIIKQVNLIFHNGSARNFVLSNETYDTADVIRIPGDPINDLDALLNELIAIKETNIKPVNKNSTQIPKRIKTLKSAIEKLNNSSFLFPTFQHFDDGTIQLNTSIFNYSKERFENKLGPILCEGRWSTGKTVSTLRIGLELNKNGFTTYYLDFADDIAGQEENILKDFLHKTLEKFNSDKNVFILDNVHLFPEQTYTIARWAGREKCNCIFVGRPLSIEFKETHYYYPTLFESRDLEGDNEIESTEILSPKISFQPNIDYIKSIFTSKMDSIGRTDKLQNSDIEKFAKAIAFNLSFIAFHVSKLTVKTANIYEPNYKLLYALINDKYHLSRFTEELFTIAALSYLDCKADCAAIFLTNKDKQTHFISSQEHLLERRNFIYGMHSATGRLILDVGIKEGLIRTDTNDLCYSFDAALKFLLGRYLLNKPLNIYEIFCGLSTYEYEAEEASDDKASEDARELIYHLLTNPKLNVHYSEIIAHRTNSLLKFGFFVRTFLKHRVEAPIFFSVVNQEIITKLLTNFIDFNKKRHGGKYFITWHFKCAWVALRNMDRNLAGFFLQQFPLDSLVLHASTSIVNFSAVLEMAMYHPFIDDLLHANITKIVGDETSFKTKFRRCSELRIFFFMRILYKLSSGNFKNNKLIETVKSFISPEEYADFIKALPKISLLSFNTAKRYFGRDYSDLLQKSFDKNFIYNLCYDQPLYKINTVLSESGWKKFLKTDLKQKLDVSSIGDISTFIRNIVLHGIAKNNCDELIHKLYTEGITDLLIRKLLTADIDDIFNFFWQLKTLNEPLFDAYFTVYCSKTELEFEPLRIAKTRTATSFLFLIYCYSKEINSKTLVTKDHISTHLKSAITNNSLVDKIFLSSLSPIFGLPLNIPYNPSAEKIRGLHFAEDLFQTLDEERNRFDVYDYLFHWWESKILLLSASFIGLNKIDQSILKEHRFEKSTIDYLFDVRLILKNLEDNLPVLSSKISDDVQLSLNRISILKMVLDIYK